MLRNFEKTIEGLKCCISPSKECEECPYSEEAKCGTKQRIDALSVIMAQQDQIRLLRKRLREATVKGENND